MKMLRMLCCALPTLVMGSHLAMGQGGSEAALAAAVAAAEHHYNAAATMPALLYNGPEYEDYSRRYSSRTGHQFFLTPEQQPGAVHYNGYYFRNVALRYDVVRDQVVLQPPTNPLTLLLINEKVRSFELGNHRFVRLLADSSATPVITTGYYEVLVDSAVQVLAKRSKKIQEHAAQRQVSVTFLLADRLFARKAGTYVLVKNKAAALRLFADREPEMQQYLRQHRLKFGRKRLEGSLVQLARHYNSLPRL